MKKWYIIGGILVLGLGGYLYYDYRKKKKLTPVVVQATANTESEPAPVTSQPQINPASFAPANHTHSWESITGKPNFGNKILFAGRVALGDRPNGNDELYIVKLPQFVPTANYVVAGSLVSTGNDWNADNDVIWMVRTKSISQFELLLREVASNRQNLAFDFALIEMTA